MTSSSLPERVVAIMFYGRSGSYFMHSLLDGHPELLILPGYLETFFCRFWDEAKGLSSKDAIGALTRYFAAFFDARNKCPVGGEFTNLGPNRDQVLGIDPLIFFPAMKRLLGDTPRVSRKLLFQALHLAYHEALGRPPIENPVLVYSLHNPHPGRARELVRDFPNTLFLHMIRDPIQSLGSHYRSNSDERPIFADNLAWVMNAILMGGKPVLSGYTDRSRAVRLEDLKKNPRETLRKVCNWLGISWNDSLLESTLDGLQYWFKAAKGEEITGFSDTALKRKHDTYYTPFDRLRLKILLSAKLRYWNYPTSAWQNWRWVRTMLFPFLLFSFRMETLAWPNYSNRALADWFIIRQILWQTWKDLFRETRPELKLLEEQPGRGFEQASDQVVSSLIKQIEPLMAANRRTEAISALTPHFHHFSKNPQLARLLATLYLSVGSPKAALETLKTTLSLAADSADLHVMCATIHMSQDGKLPQDPVAAAAACEKALEIDPCQTKAHLILGQVLLGRGQNRAAQEQLERAVRHGVDNLDAWIHLTLAARENDDGPTYDIGRFMIDLLHPKHPTLNLFKERSPSATDRMDTGKNPEVILPERVAAIVCYGDSGTLFLQSLLDSHPDVLSIPGYFTKFFDFWEQTKDETPKQRIVSFIRFYSVFFDTRNPCPGANGETFTHMGPDQNEPIGVSPVRFIRSLLDHLGPEEEQNRQRFFQAVHLAYHEALGRTAPANPLILFQMHNVNPHRCRMLTHDFPDTLFLHIVRQPIRSLGSHFSHYVEHLVKPGKPAITQDILAWLLNDHFFGGPPTLPEYAHRSRAVTFENLKTNPRETMSRIASWLGLSWNDSLLNSTFDGKQWWYRTYTGSERQTGFSPVSLKERYEKHLPLFDRLRLKLLLAAKGKAWGYKAPVGARLWRHLMLPTLLFSLKMERRAWPHDSGDPLQEWLQIREILWRAWRDQFNDTRKEVPLLPEKPECGFGKSPDLVARLLLAQASDLTRTGHLQKAESELRHHLQRFPENLELALFLATLQNSLKNTTAAVRTLKQALKHHPDAAEVHAQLGIAHMNAGDLNGAMTSFRQAIDLNEHQIDAWIQLGQILVSLKKEREALELLKKGVAFGVTNPELLSILALAALQAGDMKTYETALFMIESLDSKHPNLNLLRQMRGAGSPEKHRAVS